MNQSTPVSRKQAAPTTNKQTAIGRFEAWNAIEKHMTNSKKIMVARLRSIIRKTIIYIDRTINDVNMSGITTPTK